MERIGVDYRINVKHIEGSDLLFMLRMIKMDEQDGEEMSKCCKWVEQRLDYGDMEVEWM